MVQRALLTSLIRGSSFKRLTYQVALPCLDSSTDFTVIARHEVPKQSPEREGPGLKIATLPLRSGLWLAMTEEEGSEPRKDACSGLYYRSRADHLTHVARSSTPMAASPAPKKKGAAGLKACHKKPAIRLAGKRVMPTAP